MSIPGAGTPHEPSRGGSEVGVKVPSAQVSVMPQPSASRMPLTPWNAVCAFSGSGAPPEPQSFSDLRLSGLSAG